MANSKTATTKSAKPTKASQTTKPASKTTNIKPTSPSKPVTAKASTSKSNITKTKSTKKKPNFLAWIVGAVIIVAVAIVAIVSIVNASNSSLTVKDGTGDKITTEYISFDNSAFKLKIPTSFHALSTDDVKKKYGTDTPEAVYANADNTVNIAISPSDNTLKNDQIKTHLDAMKTLLNISGDIIDDNYTTKEGHNISSIQIITDAEDGKYYNQMMFFSQNDKLVTITFNCKDNERNKWQPVGEFILNSLTFKK